MQMRIALRKYGPVLIIALLFCTGAVFIGKGVFIFAKAQLAQILLEGSWKAVCEQKENIKPWPWADFSPVAALLFPGETRKTIVVNSASGTSLAFAPGHLDGSAAPGSDGNCVIFGHRETHFNVLSRLALGDTIVLFTQDNKKRTYKVSDIRIIDKSRTIVTSPSPDEKLTLITCYPFNALLPGPERYMVVAKACE